MIAALIEWVGRRKRLPHQRTSEDQADVSNYAARLQEVRAAKRRQEVVERHLVHQVGDVHRSRDALVAFLVEQVVGADAEVERVARFFRSGLWSSFSWLSKLSYPPCGSTSSFEVTLPMAPLGPTQSEIGLSTVANTPLQAKPMVTC